MITGFLFIFIFIIISKHVQAIPKDIKKENIHNIENILINRMKIMKEGLFESKDLEYIKEELMKFEKGENLENDLYFLEDFREYPVDLEYPESLEITDFKTLEKNHGSINYKVKILWNVSGFDESYEEIIEYNIIIKYEDDKPYMVEFKPFGL